MINPQTPILNYDDFLRLVRAAAWSLITQRQGLPPALPPAPDLAALTMAELGLGDERPAFHRTLTSFLGLAEAPPPAPEATAAHYAEALMNRWLGGRREIVFFTSGSTGEPKPNPHSETLLCQEALETAGLFQNVRRVAAAVPLLHSYGFIFGLMLPKILGLPVIDVPPLPTVLAETLAPGDLVVGFPLLWARLSTRPPAGVQVLSATAPCPDETIKSLSDNGFSKYTEIYGSSETGAVAVRFAPGPFQLLSYWRQADEGGLARRLPDGGELIYPQPDHLLWQGRRNFKPAGRIDLAVQVAGVNVYPGRVAAIIKEHPQVRDCLVRLMRPAEGFRLKAFIVPVPEASEARLRQDLNRFLRLRLSPQERPGHLTFGPQAPCSPAGKAADWPIYSSY